jgi:hypothetical protein
MPTVYLRKDLYDSIVQKREDATAFTNKAVENALRGIPEAPKGKVKKGA